MDRQLDRIKQTLSSATRVAFDLKAFCFDKQFEFIRDPSKFKTVCTSRRAGKTVAIVGDFIETCLNHANINCLYITLSRLNAKRILWSYLVAINQDFGLNAEMNLSELTMKFPNNSMIYLSGAHDESEIEKFRGMAFKKVCIDECQSFKLYLNDLINSVIIPSLYDYDGSLILTGTPGAIRAGAFYDACTGKPPYKQYKTFHWTIYDNPFIEKKAGKSVEKLIQEDLQRKGITKSDPTFKREMLGIWEDDPNALVYRFDRGRNLYDQLPLHKDWNFVLGCDIGFEDADALVVWGFSNSESKLYLIEERKKSKQTISELAEDIRSLDKEYQFAARVMDAGALGKKIQEELKQRHGIYMEAAEKTRKLEFIELMNDDLRRGMIKLPHNTELQQEWEMLQWDYDHETPREDQSFDNHLADAALYAWRRAKHFTYEAKHSEAVYAPEKWVEEFWENQAVPNQPRKEWWENV